MSVQIISDIHLDYYDIQYNNYSNIIIPSANILVIAGDLGNPFNDNYKNFLLFYSTLFIKIFIIAGNHEYYYNNIHDTNIKISEICNSFTNIHFLNNTTYEYNNILFIGTTLWSKIPINLNKKLLNLINDYKNIKNFTHYKSNKLFIDNVNFIKKELKKNKTSIIITHHAPSFMCIPKEFKQDILNCCFYSNLEYLFKFTNIIAWIYGHTHYNCNIKNIIISNCYRSKDYNNKLII